MALAFRDLGIDMGEIVEYVTYVDPVTCAVEAPKFPIPKDSHFNFLKPGSKEVLTRPVHIHEHLPPLNPPDEEPMYASGSNEKEIDVVGVPSDDSGLFKRPADGGIESNNAKKIKTEEEGRPTREITSVMMTTSGFISPAREGKLPESKPPNLPPEFPKLTPPPMISPPFKSKDSSSGQSSAADKKLEKRLKKKNHDKEKRKEKPTKDKHTLSVDSNSSFSSAFSQPPAMPREANEQMINAERKKELKKLKMKNKADLGMKRKKEKPPKFSKQQNLFDPSFMDKPKFDPFQVLPPAIPPAPSNVQAHNFLTGAATHSVFPNQLLDVFSSASNPLIEGKLVAEPDKNKLNIFKKMSKPKDDPVKSSMDFLSPGKFDRFDGNQPSTSQQVFNDPSKKLHKLPKETTMTRVDEGNAPINFSMPRSNESSFEELALPRTPTIPRTPDMKMSQGIEKKEKKERKKKEKKVEAPDWTSASQNPFMQDLSSAQNIPFLQTLKNAGGLMGNLGNFPLRNPFSLPANDFGSSLMNQTAFGMGQLGQFNQMMQNPYGFPLDMNMLQPQQQKPPKPKKVKQPKTTTPSYKEDDFLMMQSSRFANVPPPNLPERFDAHQLMNPDPFPFQHHQQQASSFDQLLKEPQIAPKKFSQEKMETFDLTSSPEPMTPAPQDFTPAPQEIHPIAVEPASLLKEKSKEKKKKKDKDKDKEKDKDIDKKDKGDKDERKKVRK